MYDDILIPTDGTDETMDAVTNGLDLASEYGATVHALHVVENPMVRAAFSPRTVRSMAVEARTTGERAVADVAALADERGVEAVTWVRHARPSLIRQRAHEVIVDYAESNDVDLIVMGATDRSGVSTALRPSITQQVMAATDVPVYGRRFVRDDGSRWDSSTGTRPGSESSD
jgi:nucleotide-binding universal stress UspA family protein